MSTMSTTSVAPEIRKRVFASRDRFWRPEDFDGSPDAVAQTLSRMTRTGDLRRVRRGLYWCGTPTRLGMAPPPPDRLVGEIVVSFCRVQMEFQPEDDLGGQGEGKTRAG